MTLLEYILVCMLTLMPARYHAPLALAIASDVNSSPALFKDDDAITVNGVPLPAKSKTAALYVAISFRESTLRPSVVGDCPGMKPADPKCTVEAGARSFGAFQRFFGDRFEKTHDGLTWKEIHESPSAQAKEAGWQLHQSFKVCPEHPIAWYAHGRDPREACEDKRSRSISADRIWLAKKIRADVSNTIHIAME